MGQRGLLFVWFTSMEGYSQMLQNRCALSLSFWGPTVYTHWGFKNVCGTSSVVTLYQVLSSGFYFLKITWATFCCWFITYMRASLPRVTKRKGKPFNTFSGIRAVLSLNFRSFKLSKLRAQSHLFLCNFFQTFPDPDFLTFHFVIFLLTFVSSSQANKAILLTVRKF